MDDDESLFGSPPSTPTRGRSPSPALALPSVSANIINFSSSSAQNVGTIALPGSHNFSELPVNPLALSLSYPVSNNADAHRPPAQTRDGFMTQVRPRNPVSTPLVARPPGPTKRNTTRKPKAKPPAVAVRPTPPPLHLPDPSHPLPPNLLRNQPGLLGTAGVVAGVRPAHLPARSAPTGTTSSNPIFVDDEPQPPVKSRFKRTLPTDVDVASLPAPSNQDIVSTLIKQRDIFPLLESILKFIASKPPGAALESFQSQSRSSSDAGSRSQTPDSVPTKKRRKLRHVPAGAELWDVPFPFNEGEGPEAYRNDWEKDRGKKLVAELVSLIKSAARKAAVQNHLEKRKTPTDAQLAAMGKHYRVDTLFYGDKSSETEVLTDASNASRSAVTPSSDPSPLPPPSPSSSSGISIPTDRSSNSTTSTPFDQLITSLLSASSNEQLSAGGGNSSLDGFFDSSAPLDPGLFNTWMDILQSFPVPAEGFTPDFKTEDYHIDPRQTFLTIPESFANPMQDSPGCALSFDFPPDFTQTFSGSSAAGQDYFPATFDNLMIDPVLLGLSASSTLPTAIDTSMMSNFSDSGCPSLAGSPIPSVSSYSSGPMTPTETGWSGDAGIGVFSPGEEYRASGAESQLVPRPDVRSSVAGSSNGKKRGFSDMAGWSDAEKEALSFLEVLSKSKFKGKGKAKAAEEDGAQDGAVGDPGTDGGKDDEFSRLPTLPIVGSLVKADVLKRAKQRREELAAQIAKTRVALWETTIEGGVLAGLVKYYSMNTS
ncbi:hypothetical protein B0H19DRAFT_1188567 [Mycena capillaripes]|nr:hypothetical protein B0H19DRAFT_1188567 [Mycena capillaripes]